MISSFVVDDNAHLMQRLLQLLEIKSYDSINYVNGLLVVNSGHISESFIKGIIKDRGLQYLYDSTIEHVKFSTKIKISDYEMVFCLLNSISSFRDNNDNVIPSDQIKLIDGDLYNILI